ncbi:MAG TPA: GcrA family cell cycle regulator [Bryobacteraceae bacterium]|nr:GcrA family cell cycle regulator [Bryobacteraceae bacterium]
MGKPWPPEDIAKLERLVKEGMTGTQISVEFRGAYSRNAILGKIDRINVKRPDKRKLARPPKAVNAYRFVPAVKKNPSAPVARPAPWSPPWPLVTFMENQGCKFPCTETKPFMFCGGERVAETPYCKDHNRIAWRRT